MKFKCNHTGNVVEFNLDHDIKDMQRHPDYTEVKEEEVVVEKVVKVKTKVQEE